MQDSTSNGNDGGFAEATTTVLQSFFNNQAFFRGVQELIIEDSETDHTLHRNALVLTLSQFCLSTG